MLLTEKIHVGSYTCIAQARDQKVLFYIKFGSYQGSWVMLAKSDQYYIYKDYYGSCSGCDSLQATFDYGEVSKAEVLKFAEDYKPFLEVPTETMKNLCKNKTLQSIMPKNKGRDYYSDDIDWEEFIRDAMVGVKIEEKMEITIDDIKNCRNQELKQTALKQFGYERFVEQSDAITLDEEGENKLLKINEIVFAYVKDSSTPRRYLLRVPGNMKKIKQAIAWTFEIDPKEYNPIIET